jgi:ribonuclease D
MFHLIQQQHDLMPVLALMQQHNVYGLDTEFIKVDTLWPKLGVFQINVAGHIYLLDGTSLDLNEFWQILFSAKQNVFHACGEDIDLIYHYAQQKSLNNVFDTQVGLSFLGYGLQVSYQNALKTILNVDIDKDQTRSDWLARPLTAKQLEYAANDVVYLLQLSEQIKNELKEKGLLDCVLEDCRNLTYEIGTETPLEFIYQDIGNYRHSRRQLMQLQQLGVWREQIAKAMNIPRSFVLKNTTMLDLVEKFPKNNYQLANSKDIRQNVMREYGKTILDLLKFMPEPESWPLRMARPIRHSSAEFGEKIDHIIMQASEQCQVPKEVLMRKKWMNALYHHVVFGRDEQDLPGYLLGWRYDLLTKPLLQVLNNDLDYLTTQMKVRD